MTISTIQQTIEISAADLVTISDIVEDTENSVWVREIKVFGAPTIVSTARPLYFTLRVTSTTEDGVKMNAPAQVF